MGCLVENKASRQRKAPKKSALKQRHRIEPNSKLSLSLIEKPPTTKQTSPLPMVGTKREARILKVGKQGPKARK